MSDQDVRPPTWGEDEAEARCLVLTRSGGVCEVCGRFSVAEAAHRVGRAVGGPWAAGNILGACRACHRRDHAHPRAAYAFGWHVQGHRTAYLDAPALLVVAGVPTWVRLDDAGRRLPLDGAEVARLRESGVLPSVDDEAEWDVIRSAMTSGY